ncbi:MAG: DMT family transporter [bacterium]
MEEIKSGKNGTIKAIAATLLGFILLATVSVFIKLELSAGASIEWVVFIQYLTGFVIIILISSKNKFHGLKTTKIKFHLIRGITGVLAFSCFTIAVTEIPMVNAALLNNSAPIFIPLITLIWLKTKVDEKIWWGIFVGFIGIILILNPGAGGFLKSGDLIGLAAGIFLAIAYVSLGVLTKTESFVTILFYYSLIAVVFSFPFAISNWSNPPLIIWVYGISSGVFFISYLYLLQFAYRFMPAVKLAPLNFSVVIFTGIFDWIIFGHVPGLISLLGIVLVIAGGILAITLHEKNNKELKHHWHW